MRPVLVIIADVVIHEAFQMVFVQNDHVIEQIPAARTNEPFRDAILPRASEAGPFRFDTEAPYCIDYVAVEIRGPIKDQVFGSAIVKVFIVSHLRNYETTVQLLYGAGRSQSISLYPAGNFRSVL